MKWHLNSEYLVCLIIFFAFLGITVPYGFPIFTPLVALVFLLSIIARKNIYIKINAFFVSFVIIILLYFYGLYLGKPPTTNLYLSEIANIISYIMIWIIISPWEKQNYNKMFAYLRMILIANGFVFSILGIVKYLMLGQGKYITFLYTFEKYPQGTSLIVDYNMFSLSLIATLILCLFSLKRNINSVFFIYLLITIFTCSLAIVFSGSRRGWIILILILVFIVFYFIKLVISSKRFKTKNVLYLFISFGSLFLLFLFSKINNMSLFFADSAYIKGLLQRLFGLYDSNVDDSGLDSRNVRWDYGFELFRDSELKNKIFGNGFHYLQNYADYFNNVIDTDYPHNFILSSILYSGILGSLGIIIFLLVVFKYAFKGFKYNKELSLIFFVSIMFALISGNTIFSHKVFFVLILIIVGYSATPDLEKKY